MQFRLVFCCIGLAGSVLAPLAGRAAPPAVADYAELPVAWGARLSPDGRSIAAIGALGGRPAILVKHLDGRPTKVFSAEGWSPSGVLWKTDDTVLASLHTVVMNYDSGHPYTQTRLLIARADGSRVRSAEFAYVGSGSQPDIEREVLSILPNDPDHILVSMASQAGMLGIRYDLADDGRAVAVDTFDNIQAWAADAAGVVRAGYKLQQASMTRRRREATIYARTSAQDRWHPVLTQTVDHKSDLDLAGFSDTDPDLVYITRDGATGFRQIEAWRIGTGEQVSTLAADPAADVTPFRRNGRLLGYSVKGGTPIYLNPAWAHDQHAVAQALGQAGVAILDRTADGKHLLAQVREGTHPPVDWVLDRSGPKTMLSPVIRAYDAIPDAQLAPARWVSYEARDGLAIPAILTMPPGAAHGPIPFVVLPHGGPTYHDTLGFDWLAQFIASRGYGVLQPQFRGSTGFGRALENAGLQQWGLAMQDDLTDGTRWLAAQRLADPARIAIVGASYGGYAALEGVEREPSLYRCAVAIAPVSDLPDMLGGMRYFSDSDLELPVAGANYAQIIATSPATNVRRITVPVLLLHGERDFTVPVTQSRHMERAMKDAGKTVEAIYLPGGDHYLETADDRAVVLTALERFLGANMGAVR